MEGDWPSRKRLRLSMACNECRRRKVKCDTESPKCRNCRLRNDICTTTDPKRPHIPISRVWIEQPEAPRSSSTASQTFLSQNFVSPQSSALLTGMSNISHSPQSITAPASEDKGISPAQQPYEMAFNTDASTDRIKMMGSSSSQCLMKSFDVYLESAGMKPLSGNFRHGMQQAEEMEIPLIASLPTLPEKNRRQLYVSVFFDKIHPLYPLFDIDKIKATIEQFASMPDFHSLPQEQIPLLATAYLIVSLAADEEAQATTKDGTKYLTAAAGLLGHVTFMPYLPAIQTLILFTLVYRGRNKDGVGWQTLGMAIRIAYTLGLHRHSFKDPSNQHAVQNRYKQLFHARIWAICCSLEKIMQLESGRPSMIQDRDVDRDHMMGPGQHPPRGHDFLQWHMGLAQHQGLISHHIYGHNSGDRLAREILSDTARLDRSLSSWAREIPEEFRPGNDLFCSSHQFHIAALLSIQYYQTVIALHRAALISPASKFLPEVANHCSDDSATLRLQAGEAICVSSARSIARLGIELSDRNIQSRILTAGPYLLACIVLGISLMKNPGSRIVAANLELLKACGEYTADQYVKSGYNALFTGGITSIYEQVRLHVDQKSNEPHTYVKATKPSLTADPNPDQQISSQGGLNKLQPINSRKPHNESIHLRELTTSTHSFEDPQSSTNPGILEPSVHNGIFDLGMDDPLLLRTGQDIYSSSLPFDNLNVQELWTWMGDLDGFDNQSYQGMFEGNRT